MLTLFWKYYFGIQRVLVLMGWGNSIILRLRNIAKKRREENSGNGRGCFWVRRRSHYIELQASSPVMDFIHFGFRITVAELKGVEFQSTVVGHCSGTEMFCIPWYCFLLLTDAFCLNTSNWAKISCLGLMLVQWYIFDWAKTNKFNLFGPIYVLGIPMAWVQ